jgi:hypothetical protein
MNYKDVLFFAANSKNAANPSIFSHSARMSTFFIKKSASLPVQKVPSLH